MCVLMMLRVRRKSQGGDSDTRNKKRDINRKKVLMMKREAERIRGIFLERTCVKKEKK